MSAIPAGAEASRLATPAEITDIAAGDVAAATGGIGCWSVRLTTATAKTGRWARPSGSGAAGCAASNEFIVVTTAFTGDGSWADIYSGLTSDGDRRRCESQDVPAQVGRDLKVCNGSRRPAGARKCDIETPDGAGYYALRAFRASCDTGLDVIDGLQTRHTARMSFSISVNGRRWRCRVQARGYELSLETCKCGRAWVKAYSGA